MRSPAWCATLAGLTVASACSSGSPRDVSTPTPVAAGLSIAGRERHYDVTGASVEALRDAMRRHGPTDHDGGRRDALTMWDMEWTYRDRRTAAGCELRDVRVTLNLTVTLPRWTPTAGASARLARSWSTFLERVQVHEAGHRAIAEQSARDLVAALSSLRGTSCQELWDRAARTATQVVEAGQPRVRRGDEARPDTGGGVGAMRGA